MSPRARILLDAGWRFHAGDPEDVDAALDAEGHPAPTADNRIRFRVEGPGELVATDNGDPTDMTPFPSHERAAFSGKALAIVRAVPGRTGTVVVHSEADGLQSASARIALDAEGDAR